jgi:hypothetical protein
MRQQPIARFDPLHAAGAAADAVLQEYYQRCRCAALRAACCQAQHTTPRPQTPRGGCRMHRDAEAHRAQETHAALVLQACWRGCWQRAALASLRCARRAVAARQRGVHCLHCPQQQAAPLPHAPQAHSGHHPAALAGLPGAAQVCGSAGRPQHAAAAGEGSCSACVRAGHMHLLLLTRLRACSLPPPRCTRPLHHRPTATALRP